MARHSRKGSRASSSYTGSRATSPPPPYSPPYAGEPHRQQPPPPELTSAPGAGPAGISAAAHLRNSPAARGVDFEITVFEAGSAIGGQLTQFGSPDSPEGAGGPVFPYNDSALDPLRAEDVAGPALLWGTPLFTRSSEDILGGDELEFFDLPSQKVGYYSGDRHEVFVQTTRPYHQTPTWDWLGLILRYGASVWRAGGLLDESAGLRERMASAAATDTASSAFADVPAILASLLGESALPHEGAPETLRRLGVSEAYAAEVLAPQVERGGPSVRISWMSGLALAMLAGREDAGDAHAGGDYTARIREIAKSLGADVRVRSKVVGIERGRPGSGEGENRPVARWLLQHEGAAEAEAFDKVIVAAPGLEGLVVRAAGANGSVEAEEAVEFDAAHVTFFTASELPGRLGGGDWAPPQILFVGDDAEGGMHEVAYVREVVRHHRDGAAGGAPAVLEHLYRCVSGADVSEALLSEPGVTWVHHHRLDHAYPLTYPRTSYPPFAVGDGLWTTAPIYSIGSSLDLSWLTGRVVAQQVIEAVKK
ncbi:hypothetical protein DL762_004419 [Monosporascus cannonballus]|uniref:Prenylcysteine lyase domain-containing protein n=1 Tax=Monosporascus cannonballus TaxID=155416 RepID=A0ABY0H8P8_9PEZI|nr:hypothetical protein DL762_004419 [Monosporascus cannonballus]